MPWFYCWFCGIQILRGHDWSPDVLEKEEQLLLGYNHSQSLLQRNTGREGIFVFYWDVKTPQIWTSRTSFLSQYPATILTLVNGKWVLEANECKIQKNPLGSSQELKNPWIFCYFLGLVLLLEDLHHTFQAIQIINTSATPNCIFCGFSGSF